MAKPHLASDLAAMYTTNRCSARIRDAAAPYGGSWEEREEFPAETVLRDLRNGALEPDALRIVARYSVIRYLLLQDGEAEQILIDHAHRAAAEYLQAAGPGWPEGASLARALEYGSACEVITALLADAATHAESAGHFHGAHGIRRAAWILARRELLLERSAQIARAQAAFFQRRGERTLARAWEREATRLTRLSDLGPPPSRS